MAEAPLDAPITLDQLRVFLAVVEAGSFSRAARRLRRVQSAVSYSIANLERLLSVELFDRSGRTPVLTDAGRSLLPDARAVCERMDRLHASARAITEGIEPRLSLAVDVLFPMERLLDALRELSVRYPLVALHLRTEALGAVTQLVLDGTCQIGIGVGLVEGRELHAEPVTSIELIPVAAPDHALAQADDTPDEERVREAIQIVVTDCSALTEGRDHGVYSERTWRVADLDSKREMILAGFGWGQMPLHRVQADIEAGRLVRLTTGVTPDEVRIPLVALHRVADPPGPAGRWLLTRLAD